MKHWEQRGNVKKHFNASEIARIEGFSRAAITRYIKDGKFGNVHKVGGQWRISANAYEKWKKQNK